MRTDHRRPAAVRLLSWFCILLLLFSFALVVMEAGHACTGDDCPVCALLRTVLHSDPMGLTAAGGVLFAVPAALLFAFLFLRACRCGKTPVLEKTRMND